MRARLVGIAGLGLVAWAGACSSTASNSPPLSVDGGQASDATTNDDAPNSTDAGLDGTTPPTACGPSSLFLGVAGVKELTGSTEAGATIDGWARLSPDELSVVWSSNRDGAFRLFGASRASTTVPFAGVTALDIPLGGGLLSLYAPTFGDAPDDLFFAEFRGTGVESILETTRTAGVWAPPTSVTGTALGVNRRVDAPYLTRDRKTLVFSGETDLSDAGGLHRSLFVSERTTVADAFTSHRQLTELDSTAEQIAPVLSDDKLTIYFATDRARADGNTEIWYAVRATESDPFSTPLPLQGLDTASLPMRPTWISGDQCDLYFDEGDGAGYTNIVRATRRP